VGILTHLVYLYKKNEIIYNFFNNFFVDEKNNYIFAVLKNMRLLKKE
jgi:hypothetical protein